MAKTCKECSNKIWARGYCQYHDRFYNPSKYKINANTSPQKKVSVKRPIKPVSNKQKLRLDAYKKIRDQFMLANPVCQYPNCTSQATDCHHSKGKTGSLLTDSRYFKALCREHHSYIEVNPTVAKQLGLSVNRLDV